ncbi:MAG: Rpn family recombination-promoting nuclease/putative transposase [Lachnospiraceae bacterium]|nr:Rpn family recombination-promoting nuclease/putative transposase [Lachnospiraceae bacterium]
MKTKDVTTKAYLEEPTRFADAFNYYLFNGEQVIDAASLRVKDPEELIFAGKGRAYQKFRDILKSCVIKQDDENTYVLLGIENQSDIHYAMPVRNQLYDALNYSEQVSKQGEENRKNKASLSSEEFLSDFRKTDKLTPVITLVIYWGDKKWDAPRSLSEMFSPIDPRIQPFINDYKINLIIPYEIDDFEKFSTELGDVLEIIKRQKEENLVDSLIREKGLEWTMSRTGVDVINEFTKSNISTKSQKGEKINMCRAFEVLEERGMEKGLKQGIEKGIDKHLIELICKKLVKGKDVRTIASEVEESEDYVSGIVKIASAYAPEYNTEKIFEAFYRNKAEKIS